MNRFFFLAIWLFFAGSSGADDMGATPANAETMGGGTTVAGNVVVNSVFDADAIAGLPDGALAARIADRLHGYTWRPQWIEEEIHGVRLPGMALSRDRSVLAIIETTGSPSGPHGSRIVFLNTANWRVVRISEFERMHLTRVCFLDRDRDLLVAVMRRQNLLEQKKNQLLFINIGDGQVVATLPLPDEGDTELLSTGKFLLVKSESSRHADIYEIGEDLTPIAREKIQMGAGVYRLAADTDGKTVLLAGKGQIATADLSSGEIIDTLTLADENEPVTVLRAGEAGNVAVSLADNRAFLFLQKERKELGMKSGGRLAFDPEDSTVLTMDRGGNLVNTWSLSGQSAGKEIKPGGLSPKTMGYMVYWSLLSHNRMFFCSSFGDIIELSRMKNNWKKKVVISALR